MKWRRLFTRTKADADHAREFSSFLEMETEDNIARGMSPDEARRAARLKFGSPTALREQVYEAGGLRLADGLLRDLGYALRVLRAAPAFTLVSLLTLAIGIGATAAIFTVVNGVILRPLPFRNPDRLVTAWEINPAYNLPGRPPGTISFSAGNFLDLREQNRSFEQIGGWPFGSYNLTGGTAPDRVSAALVSAGLVAALGVQPALGRLFVAEDDRPEAARVVVLSHSLWMERFGGDPNVVGTEIRLDDRSHTVAGVMPANFRLFNEDVDIWLPLERKTTPYDMHWRSSYYLRVIGRLKPGVSVAQARQDVDAVVQDIRRRFPGDLGKGGTVVPLLDNTIARAREPLWTLLGAVAFVLLIACTNVAHLSLGRGVARRREIALRLALGAGRGRLVRQLFTESLLLAAGGAAAGIGLAELGVRALLRLAPDEVPRAAEIHIDSWVLAFVCLVAAGSAVVFGLLPALASSKTGLREGLQGGGRSASAGPATQTARSVLIVSQIAMALVLMIGAGLMIESFRRVSAVDPGFGTRGLVAMRLALPQTRYEALNRQNAVYAQVLERLRGLAGVKAAGGVDGLPFTNGGFDNTFEIDGRPPLPPGQYLMADIRRADAGYFAAMGIPLLDGRTFSETDGTDAPKVAIVSRSLARKYWPGTRAVGQRMTVMFGPPGGIHAEVVGVAADVHPSLDAKAGEYIYLPYPQGQHVQQMDLVLRADGSRPPAETVRAAREAVASIDSELPVYRIHTMEELMAASMATRRFQMLLLGLFAGLAGCLAAVGLYGVLAYSVQSRAREIGIRTALGATSGEVSRMVLREALRVTAIGIAAGIAGALGLTRLLANLLFQVRPTEASVFIVVSVLLLGVAAAAGSIPARRAARIDPMVALRQE
jgi:putative ABC transport system permease protein